MPALAHHHWETVKISVSTKGNDNDNKKEGKDDKRSRLEYHIVKAQEDAGCDYNGKSGRHTLGPGFWALLDNIPCRITNRSSMRGGGKYGYPKYILEGQSLLHNGKTRHSEVFTGPSRYSNPEYVTVPTLYKYEDNDPILTNVKRGQLPILSWNDDDNPYIAAYGDRGGGKHFLFTHTAATWDSDKGEWTGQTCTTVWVLPIWWFQYGGDGYSPVLRYLEQQRDELEQNKTAFLTFLFGTKQLEQNNDEDNTSRSPCTLMGMVDLPQVWDLLFDMVCGLQARNGSKMEKPKDEEASGDGAGCAVC